MPPEAVPGLAQFCADLARLHVECGKPTLKHLQSRTGRATSSIWDLLNAKITTRPPDLDLVLAVVRVCAEHARANGRRVSVNTEPEYWRDAHGRLETAVPLPPPPGPDPWVALVEHHVVWDRAADADQLRHRVAEVAGRLHERYRKAVASLDGDPWLDETLAERMTAWVTTLIGTTLQTRHLEFTAAEAALVALAPLAHQVRSAVLAAKLSGVAPTDLRHRDDEDDQDRDEYQRFLANREERRLVARTRQPAAADDADDIAWWLLFHRWAESRPEDVTVAMVVDDLALDDQPLRKMLTESLERLVRLFRLPPEGLRDGQRRKLKAKASYARVTAAQQSVREDLVGLLLAVAHAQAIELMSLSSTLVEHLGISKPVDLAQLRATLHDAYWDPIAIGLGLVAECRHEAVLEALREHVGRTDVMLGAIRAAAEYDALLEPLRALPARASADLVEPAVVDGKPVFVVPVTRLRLDESRVRELLMGEQLYGDKSLAIRELYQNALDACRYAKARLEYLEETSQLLSRWEGRITFVQDVDPVDGRYYLSCTDNGIGMGESELREVFSQAGIRFADRPEFLEEKARWAKAGVEFHPNSRFGIGVMSYFMLADEIEVTTSRMDQRGDEAGPPLRVSIAGPGHLFRIERLDGPGDHGLAGHGTTVKLYLRDGAEAPSCVGALQRLLGIAEFPTSAEHDGPPVDWEPSTFKPRSSRPGEEEGIDVRGPLVSSRPADGGEVIWCREGGALLVDGLYVRQPGGRGPLARMKGASDIRGAVVNLTGHRAPPLTVDRKSVLGDVSGHVGELLAGAAADLLAEGQDAFDFDWLCSVAETSPGIADVIASVAARDGYRLSSKVGSFDLAVTGCLPLDRDLSRRSRAVYGSRFRGRKDGDSLEARLLLWRLLALGGGDGLGGTPADARPLLPALPSDQVLIELAFGLSRSPDQTWHVDVGGVVVAAVTLGRDPRSVAERLSVLGFPVGDVGRFPDRRSFDPVDLTLLSRDLDGKRPWLEPDRPVPLGHVLAAQQRTGRTVPEVVERLLRYSYQTSLPTGVSHRFSRDDHVLLSRDLDGTSPWLSEEQRVGLHHVYRAAHVLRTTVRAVAGRLDDLGFRVEPGNLEPDWVDRITPEVTGLLGSAGSMPAADGVVALSQLVNLADQWDTAPGEVARRLGDLGLRVPPPEDLPDRLEPADRALLPRVENIAGLPPGRLSVAVGHLVKVSEETGATLVEVADRLTGLGFDVVAMAAVRNGLDDFDHGLLDHLGARTGWAVESFDANVLIAVAYELERSPDEIAGRLAALGFGVPDLAHLNQVLSSIDYQLLNADGAVLVTLPAGSTVPFAHALKVARPGTWTVPDAVQRLGAMGFRVRGPEAGHESFDRLDFDLADKVGTVKPIRPHRLLATALWFELPVPEVARRLARMGLEVPDLDVELPKLLEQVPYETADRGFREGAG
ncbi:hypothetical protein FHS29_006470 [Saccharothrix tamanrassetensis]|uniref:ATP-binding protein n=1 Tax=Saccharothrix tamanrassetensis TaxID=1051531 RepID=A0A841CUM3_9PSEU|nr:hypothetical protein [Saccharothrix tamanrassetensis]MBB5959848.1 hypothetical protein [Saccharothrix tamanrassetensis]